jgi:hypothetical protein
MNDPPTALVGFGEDAGQHSCRLGMKDPPTALVGFGEDAGQHSCRLGMNDPPTALVRFQGSRSHLYFASYFKTTPVNPTAQPACLLINTTFISLAGTGAPTSIQLSPASGV